MDTTEVRRWAIDLATELHGITMFRERPGEFLARASEIANFVLSGRVPVDRGDDLAKKGNGAVPVEGIAPALTVGADSADLLEQREDKPLVAECVGHGTSSVAGVATATVAQ